MELSERWIKKFEDEGFASVYEHQDGPNIIYEEHVHQGKVSVFVTDGSVSFDFSGVKKDIKAGERFDVPPNTVHSAVVGPKGWIVIVGEEIEGDS
jgi:quercetin dioxygenase-like cupin family protein